MRRFFLSTPVSSLMKIDGGDAYHISKVLRMRQGDEVVLVGHDGQACRARITLIQPGKVEAAFVEMLTEHKESAVNIYLAQGLPKNDKMDFIVQKAVELGATGIMPLTLEHSIVQYDKIKQEKRRQRWQKIAAEAAKQCQRLTVPQIFPIESLRGLFSTLAPHTEVIMFYEGQAPQGLKTVLKACNSTNYILLVGPEGGFSAAEVQYCQSQAVKLVKMGPRILRTETAAIAAVATAMYELGDLGDMSCHG